MLASELIEILKKRIEIDGDLEVVAKEYGGSFVDIVEEDIYESVGQLVIDA